MVQVLSPLNYNNVTRTILLAMGLPLVLGPIFLFFFTVSAYFFDPFDSRLVYEFWLWLAVFWHAAYICMVAYFVRVQKFWHLFKGPRTWFIASLVLTVFAMVIIKIDASSSQYSCGDGQVMNRSFIPMWPWLLIGWFACNFFVLPERIFAFIERRSVNLRPLWSRVLLFVPAALLIGVMALPFQFREIGCSPPFDGWGFLEGGVMLAPLFVVYIYTLCVSTAVLSVLSRKLPDSKT